MMLVSYYIDIVDNKLEKYTIRCLEQDGELLKDEIHNS